MVIKSDILYKVRVGGLKTPSPNTKDGRWQLERKQTSWLCNHKLTQPKPDTKTIFIEITTKLSIYKTIYKPNTT